MDALVERINQTSNAKDVVGLSNVMNGGQWLTLDSGDKRTVASHFITNIAGIVTSDSSFFKSAKFVDACQVSLRHLPSGALENAADNILRQALFEHFLGQDSFISAAEVLASTRMEEEPNSVYFKSPLDKCNIYVKIAECYLQENYTSEADSFVTKAGSIVENIPNPEEQRSLILRYKSTSAQVMDSNRKFLQAASRYHELSQLHEEVDADELLLILGRAAICAMLAPTGAQKRRILGLIYNDPRLLMLEGVSQFSSVPAAIRKMYMHQVLTKHQISKIDSSLAEHQRALRGDGLTIMDYAMIQHNILAIQGLYSNIYMDDVARLLGMANAKDAQAMVCNMIKDGTLLASIDEVDGLLEFQQIYQVSPIAAWDDAITTECVQLNKVAAEVESS